MVEIVSVQRPYMTHVGDHSAWRMTILKLSCDTRVILRLHSKAPQGYPIRIPKVVSVSPGRRRCSVDHWDETVSTVETLDIDHIFYPTQKKDVCLRLRNCEHLLLLKIATNLPQIEEYIDGDENSPSMLCQWFGITIPPYVRGIPKKRRRK